MRNDNTHTTKNGEPLLDRCKCGGEAGIDLTDFEWASSQSFHVKCLKCGVRTPVGSAKSPVSKERAIKIWNTRTPAPMNDNTHTGIDWIAKIRSVDKDVNMASAVLTEHGFLSVCEWAVKTYLSHTPAEPKAGDWDAVLLDTLLYSQGHGIKTPPHEDPSDILDEYEKSIPDGAYRESIRSIRRALSSAASQPKAGDWEAGLADLSLPMFDEKDGREMEVGRFVYLSEAIPFLRRALSSAAPRITDVTSLQRYRLGLRVVDGIAEAPTIEEDPNGSLVAFNHVLNLVAPAPLSGITEEMVREIRNEAWVEQDPGSDRDFLVVRLDDVLAILRQQPPFTPTSHQVTSEPTQTEE